MKEKLREILKGLTRYYQKRRIRELLRPLPEDLQSVLLQDLLEIIDIPDRREKARRIREIFKGVKEQLNGSHEQKIAACRENFLELMEKAAVNVIAPDFPMARIVIDHEMLEQKAKAKLMLKSIEAEIMLLPQVKKFLLFSACMGVFLSTIANYMTVSAKFGNDWIGGNEIITGICNLFFSLLINVFEAIGLFLILHFISEKYSKGLARLMGIIGALLVVFGIVIMIFSRTEIGANLMAGAQMGGKVE